MHFFVLEDANNRNKLTKLEEQIASCLFETVWRRDGAETVDGVETVSIFFLALTTVQFGVEMVCNETVWCRDGLVSRHPEPTCLLDGSLLLVVSNVCCFATF